MHGDGERGEAFVVWTAPVHGSECAGRVERVATSERVSFGNAEELIAVLSSGADTRSQPADPRTNSEKKEN